AAAVLAVMSLGIAANIALLEASEQDGLGELRPISALNAVPLETGPATVTTGTTTSAAAGDRVTPGPTDDSGHDTHSEHRRHDDD
ncbi:MAG: hypothetical protein KC479_15020, partial [Dehalococcoidia bacterium]|nr:hypothetical protein [Dehalococcoidia bacterium]